MNNEKKYGNYTLDQEGWHKYHITKNEKNASTSLLTSQSLNALRTFQTVTK